MNYKEAINDNNWVEAMNNEMEALNRNQTWEITDLPKGRRPIGCKWIYIIKYKSNGEIERYKSRLVVKGLSQSEGIYYDETFSPVVKISTVRCLIVIAVKNKLPLFQLNVNNAFLYGDLEEDVYKRIPEGYASKSNENKVYK
ncbi:putative RNA-directed DNA polymerase [Tanacetum coccineum]